jgi:hypothetical protein
MKIGFNREEGSLTFENGTTISVCIYSFNDINNNLVFQLAVYNGDNFEYWCRVSSNEMYNKIDSNFICQENNVRINFRDKQIYLRTSNEKYLDWESSKNYFWNDSKLNTSLQRSRTNNNSFLNRVTPVGFSNWVRYVKTHVTNKHLIKDTRQNGDKNIVLEFLIHQAVLIQILIIQDSPSNVFFIYYPDAPGRYKYIPIQVVKTGNVQSFFAEWNVAQPRATPNIYRIDFNMDPNNLLTLTQNNTPISSLEYNESIGYSFKPVA